MSARVVIIEHEPGCPPDRLVAWLGSEVVADVVRPWRGDDLPGVASLDALIVLGGQMGAYDDTVAAWLPATRRLLAAAVARDLPVLGICLGAQLLAAACGGRVERGAAGVETGVVDVRWRPAAGDDVLTAGLPAPFPGPSMHQDAIVELPPGAAWLGASTLYQHQVFRVGTAAWGVQFHPEVSPGIYRQWAEHDPSEAKARAVQELIARDDEVVAGGRLLAGRFAALVQERAAHRDRGAAAPLPMRLPA